MSAYRRNVIIGLFLLGGLTAMGILIVKFGETSTFLQQGYLVNAQFERLVGMREGVDVSMLGVPIGRVKHVLLAKSEKSTDDTAVSIEGAVVVMEIQDKFSVPDGSVANVVSSLMGQPSIDIVPPPGAARPLPRDGKAVIPGRQLPALSQIIDPELEVTVKRATAQVGQLAEALKPAAHDLHMLLEQRTTAEVDAAKAAATAPGAPTTQQVTANLYTAVERLHNVLDRIEDVVGDPAVQSNFKETLFNLRVASEDARQAAANFRTFGEQAQQIGVKVDSVVVKLDDTLDTTQRNIDELGRSLLANSDKMSRMFDYFILASRDIAEGKGTIGMLLRDPQFYEELILTVQRLRDAATDLQVLIRTWQKQGLLGAR